MTSPYRGASMRGIILGIALCFSSAAFAHHGWAWTEDEETQMSGKLEKIHLGNPHAHVELRNEQGLWEVDLAPPGPTERSGFIDGVAKVGDTATVTGPPLQGPERARIQGRDDHRERQDVRRLSVSVQDVEAGRLS